MDSLSETISILVSLVSLLLILVFFLTIFYLIKRNGFYINVNCWFCNSWTKVLYKDRNSFCCPFCLQYNGFNEDGGYNKVIEAQFDISFNKYNNKVNAKTDYLSNGLCTYCNNNQQLKVRQLANFVPLDEKNYDVEVEHFRAQLEKSYKLCRKCDKVLQNTIEKQHAWIFGNRIKSLQKGTHKPNSNKLKTFNTSKKYVILNLIRFLLILFSSIILCQAIYAKIIYSKITVKAYVPDIFVPYMVLLDNRCHIISNSTENLIKIMSSKLNLYLSPHLRINIDILPLTWNGLILEVVLLMWTPKPILWKANELLGSIILVATSSSTFHDDYFVYVNTAQIISSIAVIYSLLAVNGNGGQKLSRRKKFTFKKLKTVTNAADSSDEETSEEMSNSSLYSKNSFSGRSSKCNNSVNRNQLHSPNFIFQNVPQNTANFNDTFITASSTKSSSRFNTSHKNDSTNSSNHELHRSLDNLHLSNLNFKPQPCTSPVFSVNSVNRPIVSPPKLKNITQNSWTAGGFWKNDVSTFPVATDFANLSRSSSQSSGFVSNNDPMVPNAYNSLPSSREPSLYGDYEKTSILSEPAYHFKSIHSSSNIGQSKNIFSVNNCQLDRQSPPKASRLFYKADNNMFYPVLKHNNMLLIQGSDIPRFSFESSFSNLSLKSLNMYSNRFNSPVFGEKPVISSLFKNLQGVSMQSHSFRAPHY